MSVLGVWLSHSTPRFPALCVAPCVTSSHVLLIQPLHILTNRSADPRPFLPFSQTTIMRLLSQGWTHTHTNIHTHTHTQMFQSMQPYMYLRSWGDTKSWSNKTRDIKGLCKHQFSSRYVSYKDMQWGGEWREDSESVCVVLQQQTKEPEGGKGDGGKKKKSLSVRAVTLYELNPYQKPPDHRLDMELFHSHDWAADIYPQSHRVMEPVCPSCAVIVWPFTSCPPDHCCSSGEHGAIFAATNAINSIRFFFPLRLNDKVLHAIWNCKGMRTTHQSKRGKVVSRVRANKMKNWVWCRAGVVETSPDSVH